MLGHSMRHTSPFVRVITACILPLLLLSSFTSFLAQPLAYASEPATQSANAMGRIIFLPLIRGPLTTPQPPPPPLTNAILRAELIAQLYDVPRGAETVFKLEVRNDGDADPQAPVEVYVPYDARFLEYTGGQYSDGGAYVKDYDGNDVLVVFPAIAPRERRSIKLYFRVRDDARVGDIAEVGRAVLAEQGGSAFGSPRVETNKAAIRVSNSYNPSGRPEVQVFPTCAGENQRIDFSASGFIPGERLSTWINLPGGNARPNDQTAEADNFGRAYFNLRPVEKGLSPANGYALVISSQDQRRQVIGAFNIKPACESLQRAAQAQRLSAQPVLEQLPTGGVTGQVIAADTGLPVPGVLVQVRDANGSLLAGTSTDAGGRYLIAVGLPDGTLTVEYIAHTSPDPTVAAYGDRSFPLVIEDGAITEQPFAVLLRGATISGTVTDATSGEGLPNVVVQVLDPMGNLRALTETAADGSYATPSLASGSYTLEFEPLFSERVRTTGYLSASLENLALFAPDNLTGQDIALSRDAGTGQISGRVTGVGGIGLADVTILISDAATGELVNLAVTDADGNYVSDPLVSGIDRYKVGFYPSLIARQASQSYVTEYYPDVADRTAATPVSVIGGTLTTAIDAELAQGGQISGTVIAADSGSGLADVPVLIYNDANELVLITSSEADGSYLSPGLAAGNYKLEFFPGFSTVTNTLRYVEQYYSNVQSIAEATPVPVNVGETSANIDVTLALGGRISGRVTAADSGAGLAAIPVLFIAGDEVLGIAFTEADGTYSSPGLAAREYTVLFLPEIFGEPYANQELAVAVSVEIGRTTPSIDVELAPLVR